MSLDSFRTFSFYTLGFVILNTTKAPDNTRDSRPNVMAFQVFKAIKARAKGTKTLVQIDPADCSKENHLPSEAKNLLQLFVTRASLDVTRFRKDLTDTRYEKMMSRLNQITTFAVSFPVWLQALTPASTIGAIL
uniref:Uncharacterized protein n=1 Tax=Glossina pallidipes TaxID=7398 RepID=A0A1A9ZSX9_GLOPL